MFGRFVAVVALVAVAQPALARGKAAPRPTKPVVLAAFPLLTYAKPVRNEDARWRMKPVSYDAPPPEPIEWRFTGNRMKMRVAF